MSIFTLGPDGSYTNYRSANYSLQLLTSGFSALIHGGFGQPNLVTVIAQNSTFDLYVNAQYVTSLTDSVYRLGFVGVDAEDRTTRTDVVFRAAKVWRH